MDFEKQLRKLARTYFYQDLYKASKENSGIHLFKNNYNFSYLQIRFLYWLEVYEILYTELATKEDDFLTENVILDDYRCDAYLIRRKKKQEYEWKKYRQEEKKQKLREKHPKKFKTGNMIPIEVDLRSE